MRPPQRTSSRIIPAHAGKTRVRCMADNAGADHPRSRGENFFALGFNCPSAGSSPLTRGKRWCQERLAFIAGIIPAHAGKTPVKPADRQANGDHPRSRGENDELTREGA